MIVYNDTVKSKLDCPTRACEKKYETRAEYRNEIDQNFENLVVQHTEMNLDMLLSHLTISYFDLA